MADAAVIGALGIDFFLDGYDFFSLEVEYALTYTTHTVIPKPCRLHTCTIHSAYSRSLHWFAPPTITPPRRAVGL